MKSEDKLDTPTTETGQVDPNGASRPESTAAEDWWVIVGNCWATTFLRRSELTEFQRGYRDVIAWGTGISALIALAALLFG